mmetsp:Transcript_25199/g.54291  ORF Transcript_25199/g.54291 Transcript_25199/m.54291 type:complete len:621 (-) Transcript_25199:131-1993(-)
MGKKSRKNKPRRSEEAAASSASAAVSSNKNAGVSESNSKNPSQRQRQQVRQSSSSGFRNPFTATALSEVNAIVSPHVVSSDEHDPVKATGGATCWICLEGLEDGDDEPLRRNCACRGDSGYAHLTCLTSFATSESDEIWTGKKKGGSNTNQLAFGRPWESCANCKQYYVGKLRGDIALEFARSTEGMVGGLRSFRHVTAKSWVTKSMIDNTNMRDVKSSSKVVSEFDKLLILIKSCYAAYEDDSNPMVAGLMGFLRANIQQTEAETNYNYAIWLAQRMRCLTRKSWGGGDFDYTAGHNVLLTGDGNDLKLLYNKWNELMNSAIAGYEGLKGTLLYSEPGTRGQVEMSKLQLMNQYSQIKKEFSYLAQDRATDNIAKDERETLELSKKLLKSTIEDSGEASTTAIRYALQHAHQMMESGKHYRPFETIDLLLKTLKTARRSLGPSHKLTGSVSSTLQTCIVSNREGAHYLDSRRAYHPVDRYEEDVDVYIMNIENWYGKQHDHGSTIAWDPSDIILKRGALIQCVDLEKASHLNDKRGWVADYDDDSGRHLVKFEDEKIKPCLVKPDNLRLIFFGKEYEPTSEECKKVAGKDGASEFPSLAKDDEDDGDDEDGEDDIPDLC